MANDAPIGWILFTIFAAIWYICYYVFIPLYVTVGTNIEANACQLCTPAQLLNSANVWAEMNLFLTILFGLVFAYGVYHFFFQSSFKSEYQNYT
jgi:hypothetical protein